MSVKAWIGVDLDSTLAFHDGVFRGHDYISEPLRPMVDRVKRWIAEGKNVRIFTARMSCDWLKGAEKQAHLDLVVGAIHTWTEKHLGVRLAVTNVKDYDMIELWDDRARQVVPNVGTAIEDRLKKADALLNAVKAINGKKRTYNDWQRLHQAVREYERASGIVG